MVLLKGLRPCGHTISSKIALDPLVSKIVLKDEFVSLVYHLCGRGFDPRHPSRGKQPTPTHFPPHLEPTRPQEERVGAALSHRPKVPGFFLGPEVGEQQ